MADIQWTNDLFATPGFPAQTRIQQMCERIWIRYFDAETNRRFVFLTNNFILPPLTIAQLFECRWQIELFFKWIKQNLRIKTFYGTSQNAVKTKIWVAISVYVLVAINKKKLHINRSLSEILQILSITLFESVPLLQILTDLQL